MNNEWIVVILGVLLPPVIDLVNRYVSNEKGRFLIAIGFSILVGGIWSVIQNGWENVAKDIGLIFATSQIVYKLWYEKSGLQDKVRGV
jgi:hypothetical protein